MKVLYKSVFVVILVFMAAVGWLYFVSVCGVNNAKRNNEASFILKTCANLGYGHAEAYLGIMYWSAAHNGDPKSFGFDSELSKEKSEKLGWKYLESASIKKRGRIAQNEIGIAYLEGAYGAKRDYEKARIWLEKATQNGDEIAPYNLADIYANGYGVEANLFEALSFLSLSAEHGYSLAKCKLEYWHQNENSYTATEKLNYLRVLIENKLGTEYRCYNKPLITEINDRFQNFISEISISASIVIERIKRAVMPDFRLNLLQSVDQRSCEVYKSAVDALFGRGGNVIRPITSPYAPFIRDDVVVAPKEFLRDTGEQELVEVDALNSDGIFQKTGIRENTRTRRIFKSFVLDTTDFFDPLRSESVTSLVDCFEGKQMKQLFWTGSLRLLNADFEKRNKNGDIDDNFGTIWSFSPVGISPNGRYALVYGQYYCGGFCDAGVFYLFKKSEVGVWEIDGHQVRSIS